MEYFIADCHFNHKNITQDGTDFEFRGFKTVAEMNETLIKNWNEKINDNDDVYILGDLYYKTNDCVGITKKLRGRKHLIVGNHDRLNAQEFLECFVEITHYRELTIMVDKIPYHLVLCHYPIACWNRQHFGSIHLYGHIHNNQHEYLYQKYLQELEMQLGYPAFAFNVGCMHWNYTPVSLDEILENYPKAKSSVNIK